MEGGVGIASDILNLSSAETYPLARSGEVLLGVAHTDFIQSSCLESSLIAKAENRKSEGPAEPMPGPRARLRPSPR